MIEQSSAPANAEQLELAALCGIAWEHRGEPDFREHIDRIADWHDRRHIRAYERRQRSTAAIAQLLRETDPARVCATEDRSSVAGVEEQVA